MIQNTKSNKIFSVQTGVTDKCYAIKLSKRLKQ